MENIEPIQALEEIKTLPFIKSWQNAYISKEQNIVNFATGKPEEKELSEFVYLPAPTLLRHYASDTRFLRFRNENKYEDDWNYELIEDKAENDNRRMVLFFIARYLESLEIEFMIDNSYALYIEIENLARLAKEKEGHYKAIYLSLSIPKAISQKVGIQEQWGA